MKSSSTLIPFDQAVQAPAFRIDPYSVYATYREHDPVHRQEAEGRVSWVVTRHADVSQLLKDKRLSSRRVREWVPPIPASDHKRPLSSHASALARRVTPLVPMFRDPPEHTTLRTALGRFFTPARARSLTPRIASFVGQLLQRARAERRLDVVRDLAMPLPLLLILDLFGMADFDIAPMRRWSRDLAIALDHTLAPNHTGAIMRSGRQFVSCLASELERRRAAPADDVLSMLLEGQAQGTQLSDDDILASALLILIAGHETTTNLIGNGFLALLRSPDVLKTLIEDRSAIAGALDEMVRFDAPVQAITRVAVEHIEVGENTVCPGHEVHLVLGAANRDGAVFERPDQLILARKNTREHVGFGSGAHYCLGAWMARAEASAAFTALFDLMQHGAVKADLVNVRWREGLVFRGLESLSVEL